MVPEAGQAAFLSRYYPRLRRQATVTSSDGSFTAPEISGPGAGGPRRPTRAATDVDVRWEWAYQVGGTELRAALGSGRDPFRDPEAEARVLAGSACPPGLPCESPRTDRVVSSGPLLRPPPCTVSTRMAFSTEVLPLLSGRDDVRVEVTGQVPDYQEAGDSLEIGVSAGELDGERDWFDLGITVTVEGREVPFAELFVALAQRPVAPAAAPTARTSRSTSRSSLALARLIEEARALQDQPDGRPLRISRFQAGLWEELAGLGVVGHQAAAWQRQVRGLLRCRRRSTRRRMPGAI